MAIPIIEPNEPARPTLKRKIKRRLAPLFYGRPRRYTNVEKLDEFNFSLHVEEKKRGSSVMLRAKNEEDSIKRCILSIYDTFDEIVFVDNGSQDKTLAIAEQIKSERDNENKIRIYSYPFAVARCGEEHANTDPNSVHSLVYYYNWCFSKLKYRYAVKGDADMYLLPEHAGRFRTYMEMIQDHELRLRFLVQTVYLDTQGNAHAAMNEYNYDVRVFPNAPYVRYVKGEHWEALHSDIYIPPYNYPYIDVFEIKDTRKNEFSHWSTLDFPTERKKLEWENFCKIRDGEIGDDFSPVTIQDL